MTPRIRNLFTFPIDDELALGLRTVKAKDGVSIAEQIRRGIQMWLKSRGVTTKKTAGSRAGARKSASTRRQR